MSIKDELDAKEAVLFGLLRKNTRSYSRDIQSLRNKLNEILLIPWHTNAQRKNRLTPEKQKEMIKAGFKITKKKKVVPTSGKRDPSKAITKLKKL